MSRFQALTTSYSTRWRENSGTSANHASGSSASSTRLAGEISKGLPAKADVVVKGEFPRPVGPSGRICQKACSPSRSQLTKARDSYPRSPTPKLPGSEVTCIRTPAARSFMGGDDILRDRPTDLLCPFASLLRSREMSEKRSSIDIACRHLAEFDLPSEVSGLYELAYNLWWSWNPSARHLFSAIDSATWSRYRNPVELLLNIDRAQWEALVGNDTFMESYGAVTRELHDYLRAVDGSWFEQRFPDFAGGPIAYFSMEFGLHQSLAIYSGGLGVLSGDHCKSASDLGLPFVAVGLLYRFGYFRQTIDADGIQQHSYPEYDFHRLPLRPARGLGGGELIVDVPFPDRTVLAKVWVVRVGRVPLLLLDTDLVDNDAADRAITNVLYVRGREMRLAQELVLGVGGARALAALGVEPVVWHVNEGHSVLLQLERLRGMLEGSDSSFEQALAGVRRRVVFTSHTPVPAGNERFDHRLALRYIAPWAESLGIDPGHLLAMGHADQGVREQPFNLTVFALRTSSYANGVSRLNAEITDRMWRHLFPDRAAQEPCVEPITNGVHVPSWIGPEMRLLLVRALGVEWMSRLLEAEAWRTISELPDEEIWSAHQAQKERLLRFARASLRRQYARHGRSPEELRRVAQLFEPGVLTIGFARRFATYKRANLIFSDLHRLRQMLCHPERPVQIFLAGKAHPADRSGQELIQHIFKLSQEEGLHGRVVFLENYDMRVARMLVQGVDVWLNTPRRPLEASGTSGQKAAANGVLNCSTLDGWWPEGFDGENGWAIGGEEEGGEDWRRDQSDAASLYQVLDGGVIPTFYDRDEAGLSRRWVYMMKRAIATITPRFSSSRMVRDYVEEAYAPLFEQATASLGVDR